MDLAAPPGSPVLAVGDGVIVKTDPGLGKTVRKLRLDVSGAWNLQHRRVDAVVYADLGTPLVQPGTIARAREFVAIWGATLTEIGPAGHINTASGHGPWPEGLALLKRRLGG